MRIAAFISPHGFGHAARTVAVLNDLFALTGELRVEIFTLVPEWFFRSSLPDGVELRYHALATDVGFVQKTPLEEDLPGTVQKLSEIYPLREELITEIAQTLRERQVAAVICDIAVMGIAAAQRAGIPSILVENFTWDWIYQPYAARELGLQQFIEYLKPIYETATARLQAQPYSMHAPLKHEIPPIARRPRSSIEATRHSLTIPLNAPLVLMTMGGMPGRFPFLPKLEALEAHYFVLAGVDHQGELPPNVRCIPHNSPYFHPDLVSAADAIVGKAGYSTVAEAYHGGTQFFYVPRPVFPEAPVLEHFVREALAGVEIPLSDFDTGGWLADLPMQMRAIPDNSSKVNGAKVVAQRVLSLV